MIKAVWQSTLDDINQTENSPLISIDEKEYDHTVPTNLAIENKIQALCNNMPYPDCSTCHKALCGPQSKETCGCPHNASFQNSYIELTNQIEKTEKSLHELANAPFRQSRNAMGFSGSVFSGLNLLFSNIATNVPLIGIIVIIALAPLFLGLYIYKRGKKEETQINAEHYANFVEEKIKALREHSNKVIASQTNTQMSLLSKSIKPKPEKEKRGIMGNSFSHFVVPSILTAGMIYAVLKYGLLASLIAAGGPVTWGIAIGVGIAVGCYFAYKRYQHLTKKIQFEENFHKLAALKNKPLDVQPAEQIRNACTHSHVKQNMQSNIPQPVKQPLIIAATSNNKAPKALTKSASFSHSSTKQLLFNKTTVDRSQSFRSPSPQDMVQSTISKLA